MFPQVIVDLIDGEILDTARAESAMNAIMDGAATPAQIAAFLTALRGRGETVAEVVGFARAMRSHVTPVPTSRRPLVDTCGTGGGGVPTINVSTAAAIVAAGAGVAIAKHGNRAATSRCGSADVLAALGVRLDQSPEQVGACIDAIGIGFLFAVALHPAMKHAAAVRREIGIRTAFNLLGPLTNPALADGQVLGSHTVALADLVAESLAQLGTRHAFVVHGLAGVDEFSIEGETHVCEVRGAEITRWRLRPADVGLDEHPLTECLGGEAPENAEAILAVLDGARGAARDFIVLNAAAAIVVGAVADDLRSGVEMAQESLDSGAARAKLEAWRAWGSPSA
jgi:anthranilate phosphoribosyltransferase